MSEPLRILILEDTPADAELAERTLRQDGLQLTTLRVETREEFGEALETLRPDLILSDYALPAFDGMSALRIALERTPETPFIIITGSLNEETAVECMRSGAWDYVLKDRIVRLPLAVRAALDLAATRRERATAERALREGEERYRELVERMSSGVVVYEAIDGGRDFVLREFSRAAERIESMKRETVLGRRVREVFPGVEELGLLAMLRRVWQTGQTEHLPTSVHHDSRITGWRENQVYRLPSGEVVAVYDDVTERKQAEVALETSRSELRAIYDSAPVMMCVLDADRHVLYGNADYVTFRGASEAELRDGKTSLVFGCVNASEDPGGCGFSARCADCSLRLAIEDTLSTGREHRDVERRLVVERHDGKHEVVVLGSTALIATTDQPRVLFCLQDVTERTRAQEELRQSERHFQTLAEISPAGIFRTDARGATTYVNRRWTEISGLSSEDALGDGWLTAVHPDDRGALAAGWSAAAAAGHDSTAEYRFVRPDGTIAWVIGQTARELNAAGHLVGFVGTITDVTERKRAELALRESEERYRLIAENTADVIWTLDLATRRFTYVSPSVERLRGYTAEEALDQTLETALTPESLRRVERTLSESLAALAAGDESARTTVIEVEERTRDGRVVPTEVAATALLDDDGRVTGILGVTRDIRDRKRAEQALSESEARYRSLFEQSPIGIYRTTPDGRILLANPALLEMLGYASVEELQQRNLEESGFQPDYPRERFKKSVEHDGELRGFEAVWTSKGGAPVKVHENAHAIRGSDGQILYYEGAVEDVTARKETEEALRKSEAQLSIAMAIAHLAYWEYDVVRDQFIFNDHFYAIFRTTAEEVGGYTMSSAEYARRFVHPDDASLVATEIATTLASDDPTPGAQLEHRIIYADGEVGYISVRYFGERDASGRVVRTFGANQDITARHRAEEVNRRLGTAVEQSAEMVLITDPGGVIQYVNPAFERITGFSQAEACGQTPRILKSGRHQREFYQKMWATVLVGEVWHGRLTNQRKDGRIYEEEMTISPVRDPRGVVVNFVAVKRDVTQEIALQQQLAQAQKMEAVGLLAGGIAHDFNNLLQAMMSQVGVLQHRFPAGIDASHTLKELDDLVRRGATLTRQLLLFSRQGTVRPERLDVNEILRSTAAMLRRLVRENVELRLELSQGRLPVEADRGQLDQVLVNLAVNASDAMPDGGRLVVRSGRDRDGVWFEVEDTGHGIPDAVRDRIFEPFFTTKAAGRGTGLGLSVVHGIVAQHHGRIELTSREGAGTTFRVSLPRSISGEFPAVGATTAALPELPSGRGERVLVVEDEAGAREGLEQILTSLGYRVVAVGSGEEAGTLPAEPPFDLLLTDLMLPGIAGPLLANGLKERWPALEVILMSGYTEDEAVRHGVNAGTVRFLQKPFDMQTLAVAIRRALAE